MPPEHVTPGRLTAARAVFIAAVGLALGWAGVVVAAIAVAAERAKNGDDVINASTGSGGWWDQWWAGVTQRRAEREQAHRDWLKRDRDRQQQLREDRQRWLAAGGAAQDEPRKPGYAVRLGRGARRNTIRARLAGAALRRQLARIGRDFKDGWQAAAPNAQYGFKAAARSRPDQPAPGGRTRPDQPGDQPEEVIDAEIIDFEPGPGPAPEPPPTTEPAPEPAPEPAEQSSAEPQDLPDEPIDSSGETGPTAVDPVEEPTGTGDREMALPKTADQVKANSNPQAVDGDDHLDRITSGLSQMGSTLAQADEKTDSLMAAARRLRAEAEATLERAGDKATTATRQACDEAMLLAQQIEELVDKVGSTSAACAESVRAADRGLDPARQSRDNLHQAGATGELLATATDG